MGSMGLFPANRLLLVGCFYVLGFIWFGCGIKGPPMPPQRPPIPAAADLNYRTVGQSVVLTWGLPVSLNRKQAARSTFGIYRSRTSLAAPACDGCPLIFEKVASVSYVTPDANRFSTAIPLDPGYRYVFKVRLETGSGAGPDSNPAQFDYLPELPSKGAETP